MTTATDEYKTILKLSLPLIATFLAQKGIQLVDTIMMGKIGINALAAGALGTSLFMTILVFCMGTLSSVGVFVSRAKGANQHEEIKINLHHGLFLAGLLAIPCMILIWLSPNFLLAIGQNPQVVYDVKLLLHAMVFGFPGLLCFLVMREFISSFHLARVVMLITTISIPLTIIGNYTLIYGKLGFPTLGIAGIGYTGTVIQWMMFLSVLVYSNKNPILKTYSKKFRFREINLQKILSMLHLGTPSGLILVLDLAMCLMAATMMGYFGADALAAHQIAMQYSSIAFSFPFALSMATALRVSHNMGANKAAQAKNSVFCGVSIGVIISFGIALILFFAPSYLVKIFLNPNQGHQFVINQLAISFLKISAIFQCLDAIQTIMSGALRGFKDTWVPMLLSIGCYWLLGIGGSYLLAFHTPLQANGIWYGITLGICSTGIVLMLRFKTIYRYKLNV